MKYILHVLAFAESCGRTRHINRQQQKKTGNFEEQGLLLTGLGGNTLRPGKKERKNQRKPGTLP